MCDLFSEPLAKDCVPVQKKRTLKSVLASNLDARAKKQACERAFVEAQESAKRYAAAAAESAAAAVLEAEVASALVEELN